MTQPAIMTDALGGNPLSTGNEDGGWKRVETENDGIGPGRGDAIPKSVSRLPRPRILTQRKNYSNTTPINLKRKEISRNQYPEVANPAAFVGLGQPTSQGTGQYFYAPNEGNLGKNGGFRSQLLLADGGLGGNGGGLVTGPVDSRHLWSDTDLDVMLGPDGYPPYAGDSNFERKVKRGSKWPSRKQNDLSLTPMRNQTNSPEPPSQFDVGNESLFYPLASLVFKAAYGDGVPGYRYGKPELLGHDVGESEVLVQVPVWALDKGGNPEGDEPYFDVRFWMSENPRSPGKAYLNTNLAAEVYEYPAGQTAFPATSPIDLGENKVARKLVQRIPVDVLTVAAEEMGFKYEGAESKAEERRGGVGELAKKMDEFFPAEKIQSIAKATEGMKKTEVDNYLRALGRELVKQAGSLIPGATAEDVAKFIREELAQIKAETPEAEPEEWVSPDFRTVTIKDLGKYMFEDHKKEYEKAPESDRNAVRELAADALGDSKAAGYDESTVKKELGKIVDSALAEPAKKKADTAKAEMPKTVKYPDDMLPQERLFRDVQGWEDDYQSYSGDDLKPAVMRVLEQKPEGDGKYFKWEYGPPDKKSGKEATLVIIRKSPWKEFQGEI